MTEPLTPEDDALAAEYALSLLEGEERAAFEARLRVDPDLAEAVASWQLSFAGQFAELEPVAPPAAAKARIMARLFEAPSGPRQGWLPGWLSAVLASAAVVVALFVVTGQDAEFRPAFTADLAAEDSPLRLVAEYDGQRDLRVRRLAGGAPEGRVLELWALEGDAAPVSLGLLEAETTRVSLPAPLAAAFAGLTLAVSEEPPGGSPTGAPTGQVLAVAPVERL